MRRTGILALAVLASTGMAQAQGVPKNVACAISAGAVGGHRFATLKCYDVKRPGDYLIRSTRWERDDKTAYGNLARLSGRRFTCEVGPTTGTRTKDDMRTTSIGIKNCR